MSALLLINHPATPCDFVSNLTVRIVAATANRIVFRYAMQGRIDQLLLPSGQCNDPGRELWRHTCFEVFFAAAAVPAYLELNCSPANDWVVYRFDDYRRGRRTLHPKPAPQIACRLQSGRFEMDVEIHPEPLISLLPAAVCEDEPAISSTDIRLGLSVVLEDLHGQLSYWALSHSQGKPDFHRQESFVARLPPVSERS